MQREIIDRDACIAVYPYAAITLNQAGEALADLEALAPHVIAFSDDGHGVQSESMMREAMTRARALGKMIVAHCEDNSLLRGGYVHDGTYAAAHGHRGICSESEWRQIERDLKLADETGCAYHVCHISTKESVALIRDAKKSGVNVSCETAPHYLLLDENDLEEDGRFKMNPPLRAEKDREALVAGLLDGTIDMIATDHAPHSAEEKSKGLQGSAFGIVGLETAFPLLYTNVVKTGILSMEALLNLLVYNPRKRFNIPLGNDFSIWDLNAKYTIDPKDFLSKGKASPFTGRSVYGKCLLTVYGGHAVYKGV
jgi:dihydroorotase